MLKGQKGITLVALVITIIVLLILAGITISLTVGQRGILNRAQEAGRNYQNAAAKEDEDLRDLNDEIEGIIRNVNGNTSVQQPAE